MTRRYLEPRTDCPAAQDWSTAQDLTEMRWGARTIGALTPALPAAVAVAVLLPITVGNLAAIIVLGVLGLFGLFGPAWLILERLPHRRRLLASPWRRVPAGVVAATDHEERVVLTEDDGQVVLRGQLADLLDLLAETGELFVLGPDEKGRAQLRVAGLCRRFTARVDPRPARPIPASAAAAPTPPPPDEQLLRHLWRVAGCWRWAAWVAGIGAVVIVLGLFPLAPAAHVVGGLLVLIGGVHVGLLRRHLCGYYAEAAAAAQTATAWTAVPFTLLPGDPFSGVAGLAQLPGRTALVQFPMPHTDVVAGLADTGTLWTWGEPRGVVAVGAPLLPVITVAVVQSDDDQPPEDPQPWLLRTLRPPLDKVLPLR